MTDILMPALSPTMEEGVLSKWHVKVGDVVSAGDVIAEIETDKATMEVEAVDEGEVLEILVDEGTEGVKVNTPIARLKGEGGTTAPAPKAAEAPKAEEKAEAAASTASPSPASSQGDGEEKVAATATAPTGKTGERIFASPLARRLAAEAGLELKSIKGTGPRGRIVKADIEAAGKGGAARAAPAPAGEAAADTPEAPDLAPRALRCSHERIGARVDGVRELERR